MTRKKAVVILLSLVAASAAVLAVFYFFVFGRMNAATEYEKLRKDMKAWDNISIPGISLYVPEDYIRKDNDFYTTYIKDDAVVSLTSEEVSNDLANYAYYAVRKYEDITDTFSIKEEFDEEILNTTVHVVEFDYSLALESDVKLFSCLSAYVMGEGRSYILTCVADAQDYPYYRDDFCRIYKTMSLVGTDKK